MNILHLQQIIENYIRRFEELNSPENAEYYKWQIAKRFQPMADEALAAKDEELPAKLYAVKRLTANVIDSYTQPFSGLVEFAKKEPETVRQMLKELFQASGAGVEKKREAILRFLNQSHQLREKYFPDSYLYNDDLHSATGYLFLYDPDHNYLYKATHCRAFADCVEIYDDWGSGENTNLKVFFKMCDEVLAVLKDSPALMAADASRRSIDPEGMHPDKEKHILLFDVIYCCSTYGLFDGISFAVPKSSERHLMQERKEKALELNAALDQAEKKWAEFNEAKAYLGEAFRIGNTVRHKLFGEGTIAEVTDTNMTVVFPNAGRKMLGMVACAVNGLVSVDNADVQARMLGYRDILQKKDVICSAVNRLKRELLAYSEYLE